jgi:CubicO group peptidase (beta-lactamase class C family)
MMIAGGLSALTFAAGGGRAADAADWPVASPESQGINKAALDGLLDAAKILDVFASLYTLRSVVVVRNGFLIDERYYDKSNISTLRYIASVAKSITSILVGIALEQGKIRSLDQTVGELLPEAAAKAPASAVNGVTLAQILTQTSGFPSADTCSRHRRISGGLREGSALLAARHRRLRLAARCRWQCPDRFGPQASRARPGETCLDDGRWRTLAGKTGRSRAMGGGEHAPSHRRGLAPRAND